MSATQHTHAADYLFEYLYQKGIRHIFGIPGDELEIFDALGHSKLNFITTRHEQGAAFMASAFGKMTDLPGVCISTLGPGATNLVTGVADAYQNRTPLIVLSGQMERAAHSTRPLTHQYIDLQALFAPITKKTFLIKSSAEIPEVIDRAFGIAMSSRRGPVHITLPVDVMEQIVKKKLARRVPKSTHQSAVDQRALDAAVALLSKAKYPMAFLGQAAQDAHPTFRSFLSDAHIPTVTSFLGKGSFDEKNRWSLGVMSRHVKDRLAEVFEKTDLIIVCGYDFVEGVHPKVFHGKTVLMIDTQPAAVENVLKPAKELIGETTNITKALAECLNKSGYRSKWNQRDIDDIRAARVSATLRGQQLGSIPLNPFAVVQALQQVASGKETIVSDVGIHKQVLGMGYRISRPHGMHFSNGLSSMGFALPFAAGLRLTMPKVAPIVAICGDGGFLMNVQELETIRRYNIDIKVVVFEDNAFGMIKANLIGKYQRVRHLDFSNPDFGELAKSFGLGYVRADRHTDMKTFWKRVLSHQGPLLASVPIRYA